MLNGVNCDSVPSISHLSVISNQILSFREQNCNERFQTIIFISGNDCSLKFYKKKSIRALILTFLIVFMYSSTQNHKKINRISSIFSSIIPYTETPTWSAPISILLHFPLENSASGKNGSASVKRPRPRFYIRYVPDLPSPGIRTMGAPGRCQMAKEQKLPFRVLVGGIKTIPPLDQ